MASARTRDSLPLAELRRQLLLRRRSLLGRVARAESDIEWLENDAEPEMVERGQDEALARLLADLDERERAEIEAIEGALVKMENGDYGRCDRCGAPIPEQRLRALPWAPTCVACAGR